MIPVITVIESLKHHQIMKGFSDKNTEKCKQF